MNTKDHLRDVGDTILVTGTEVGGGMSTSALYLLRVWAYNILQNYFPKEGNAGASETAFVFVDF